MKKLTTKLENALISTRGLVKVSISELLTNGTTSTGKNQNRKNQKWTKEVCEILAKNGIDFKSGNNAPKGGVCGEFVTLANKTFLNSIAKIKKIEQIEKLKKEAQDKIDYKNVIELTDKLFCENIDKIKSKISVKYPTLNFSHQDSKSIAYFINNRLFGAKCNTVYLARLIRENNK
jgi:hypothetical protein